MPTKVVDELDRLFGHLEKNNLFSGNVLVGNGGQKIFVKSHGRRNEENGDLLNAESKFEIASLTKAFTAMAVAILSDRNKLNLSDTTAKYFPLGLQQYGLRPVSQPC